MFKNEPILNFKYIMKNKCILMFYIYDLDAIKAFDNLWRQALFLKLKKSKNLLTSTLILLRIFYEKLSRKIKINNVLSKLIKLARGVKQGGVFSSALFNFFMDDLFQ